MGVSFTTLVYQPSFDIWAVPITVFYADLGTLGSGRGIFTTRALNVLAEGNSVYSDQETICDIREAEWSVRPKQGDHVDIPQDCNSVDQGEWEIIDHSTNGGGETTLILRKWEAPSLIPRQLLLAKPAAEDSRKYERMQAQQKLNLRLYGK